MKKVNFFNWFYHSKERASGIDKMIYHDSEHNVFKYIRTYFDESTGKTLRGAMVVKYWHPDFPEMKVNTELELFKLLEIKKLYVQEISEPIVREYKPLFR